MDLPEPTLGTISNTLDQILRLVQAHEGRFDHIDEEFNRVHKHLSEHDSQFVKVFEAIHELYGLFDIIQALSTHMDAEIGHQIDMLRSEIRADLEEMRNTMATKQDIARIEKTLEKRALEFNALNIRVARLETA